MQLEEIWKDVEGFEGRYQVSNAGRVRSFARKSYKEPKILTCIHDKYGYLLVNLYYSERGIKGKQAKVHRLVAKAFIDNPLNLPEINHKDENKQNNVVDNLEWCTTRYNLTYGNRLNCTYGSNNYHSKLTQDQVDEIRRTYIKSDPKYGQSALGRKYGVAHGSIAAIVKGKSWNKSIKGEIV